MFIRAAKTSDASQISKLSGQLGYEVNEEQILQRLVKLLNDEDNAVFVMDNDGEITGWVHVHGRHLIEPPLTSQRLAD